MGSRSFVNRAKARFPLHDLKLFSLGTDAHLALVHRSGKSGWEQFILKLWRADFAVSPALSFGIPFDSIRSKNALRAVNL
jgi:hypothetical protein